MTLLARTSPGPASSRLRRFVTRAVSAERLSLGRVAAGTVMVARPRVLPGLLGVDSATSARMGWAVQMLGAREIALGLGARAALRAGDGRAARLWLAAGVLSDGADALVLGAAAARGRLSGRTAGGLVAVATAATAVQLRALSATAE